MEGPSVGITCAEENGRSHRAHARERDAERRLRRKGCDRLCFSPASARILVTASLSPVNMTAAAQDIGKAYSTQAPVSVRLTKLCISPPFSQSR
eukprot:3003973-Pleurochrysis_carterae.AAC.3